MIRRYFYDFEFIEDGKTIEPISVGIVADDGREYYAVFCGIDWGSTYRKIRTHRWLMENVIPHLPLDRPIRHWLDGEDEPYLGGFGLDEAHPSVRTHEVIALQVRQFLSVGLDQPEPDQIELWGYYAAYDHVALMQLWGPMAAKPDGIPMWTHDLMQYAERFGAQDQLSHLGVTGQEHHALGDARQNKAMYQWLLDCYAQPF